ncbi:uncharacterized protein [Aquarana catesbeiana]|uniref:uncharacterized protein isoform X2 n=1 Tax=Aquarana catesbeiana TaxID=8400 RepID=UPI003CC9B528
MEEDTKTTHNKTGIKEEAEELCVMGDKTYKEEEIPPEISTDPKVAQRVIKVEKEEEGRVNLQRKAVLEIGTDGQYRLQNEENPPTTLDQPLSSKKPFLCSECGKFFHRKYGLTVHQRIHTGEKPFACSECGKCFSDKSNLNEHKRTHSVTESFTCSKCGRRCHTWRILATHQRVHSGEKRGIECTKCGQTFSKKLYLKRHEMRGCSMG